MSTTDDLDPFFDALVRSGPGEHSYGPEERILALMARPAWQQQAACRGVGAEVFFIDRGGKLGPALGFCDRCEVRAECLAMGHGEAVGVWGGTSANQRRADRKAA